MSRRPSSPSARVLDDLFTDAETETLVMSFARARGVRGFTEDEAQAVLQWANGVRIEQGLLEGVLHGNIGIDLTSDGAPIFAVRDRSTPGGKAAR
jgi:hypothetical protein